MKHFLLVAFIIGLGILTRAQKEYEVSTDGTNKILKGIVSRDVLENDTAFRWFHDNQVGYTPDAETVAILKAKGPALRFIVFGGTWCEDTPVGGVPGWLVRPAMAAPPRPTASSAITP